MTGAGAAIILAAGFSRRMGRLKALLPLGERTLADHIIATFVQNNLDVYVIVGYQGRAVRVGINTAAVTVVENPDYERGMFTSVQAGVRALPAGCPRFFVTPLDVPLVSPATVARLLNEAQRHPDAVIRPTFERRRGHPVLLPVRLGPRVLEWDKPGGLRALLATEADAVDVSVPDPHILFDVDIPADYEELLARFQREHISNQRST